MSVSRGETLIVPDSVLAKWSAFLTGSEQGGVLMTSLDAAGPTRPAQGIRTRAVEESLDGPGWHPSAYR